MVNGRQVTLALLILLAAVGLIGGPAYMAVAALIWLGCTAVSVVLFR